MKKLLATTAIATMAFAGAASAQSLLERVMSNIGATAGTTAQVTGVFANTADNLLAGAVPNVTNIGGTSTTADRTLQVGDVLTVDFDGSPRLVTVGADGELFLNGGSVSIGRAQLGSTVLSNGSGELKVAQTSITRADAKVTSGDTTGFTVATVTTVVDGDTFSTAGINASVNNILRGLTGPTAVTEGGASATEAVDALIGNIATTALGAVNTGDIQLIGSNLSFSEDIDTATAGTSAAVQQTIDHTVTQVGTTVGSTVLALNSALNETNVDASVTNVMSGVNATIGRSGFEIALSDVNFTAVAGMDADAIAALTGGISTTGLGAVNTGSIISGAQNQVNGVITSIVGNAAVNTSGS